ncbi:GNAT family N-acetyltransferase [Neobacillus sp. YX16]|jgi:GNAT superfamily N-acetyltransferase|uniref:GNAT family N-acetyltransferase n=1 Tax=Bacillaceae TaxID=186817 RepID=UPI000BA5CA42|nr:MULTISPECIES: GNAT family N-acetyltransferase [Bacillaceae]PAE41152.1 GNAT family N-acetyltransferase [Bacillus sp. 7884-1]WHZ04225.1 GNAT family N-acetyltransferase [Neobacillus sp. YX16]
MQTVEIRRPRMEDIEELNQFFRIVITDTFRREGLAGLIEDIEAEIDSKNNYLQLDLDSKGDQRYFLIALAGNKIIGTIEYGPASELIKNCTNGKLGNLVEVGTVFVLPEYQRQGVGNRLLGEMLQTLKGCGMVDFCLDSGYKNAQAIWKKKFGEPNYLLKDYWGQGQDHMIWKISTSGVYS